MERFGDILRHKRVEKGYYLREVCKFVGSIDITSLSQYELNKHKPTLHVLKKLCDLYLLDYTEMVKLVYGYEMEYTFGNMIKMRRQELKMNISEVSKIVDIPKTTIIEYECDNVKDIPVDNLYRLCDFYKLNYDEILDTIYPIDDSSLSSLLKSVRKRLGISRRTASKIAKCAEGSLSIIENNFRKVNYRILIKLCDLYGLKFEDICVKYYNEDINSLGFKLKTARLRSDMQQNKVAEHLEMSASYISGMESNKIIPTYDLLIDICNLYNININHIR